MPMNNTEIVRML